jgi:hypothetical protein
VLVSKSYKSSISSSNFNLFESLWVDIDMHGGTACRFGCFNRRPGADAEVVTSVIENIRENITDTKTCYVPGDFNFPGACWSDYTSSNNAESHFVDFCLESGLTQFVEEPTRNGRILDLIFSTLPNAVHSVDVSLPLASSDHSIVKFDTCFAASKQTERASRNSNQLR